MRESVNIYGWQKYSTYMHPEQRQLQRQNLTFTSLSNVPGNAISFIFTDQIAELNDYVSYMLNNIRIEDAEKTLDKEVYYTTKIEGAKTTIARTAQIHNGAPINDDDFSEKMVRNSFAATKYMNVHGNRIDEQVLIDTWKLLTKDACENTELGADGYRMSDEIQVGSYTPVQAVAIPELMNKWIDFYHNDELNDIPLVKAIILHYAFETIHPFCDGNGRMGRLLMSNFLISKGFDAVRAVSFSMAIDRTRSGYDDAFVKSENVYQDCTPLIEYMLGDVMYDSCYEICLEQGIEIRNDSDDREY